VRPGPLFGNLVETCLAWVMLQAARLLPLQL